MKVIGNTCRFYNSHCMRSAKVTPYHIVESKPTRFLGNEAVSNCFTKNFSGTIIHCFHDRGVLMKLIGIGRVFPQLPTLVMKCRAFYQMPT
jgi:hypothetical protein